MSDEFSRFFAKATGLPSPYQYQTDLAVGHWPERLVVPTGLGKTAAVVLAWLWRRFCASADIRQATPRRLVYCLPQRALVEQVHHSISCWLANLSRGEAGTTRVHMMLGGHVDAEWEAKPDEESIIVGTQDLLLSRALHRGYAMSRYRWTVPFALLSNDVQWVFDEIQLMGAALATSAQIQAFRHALGVVGPAKTLWMSATLDRTWLETVDFQPDIEESAELRPGNADLEVLAHVIHARKPLKRAESVAGDAPGLAAEISRNHQPGTLTLVIVNTVARARELLDALGRITRVKQVLIHALFRPEDRRRAVQELQAAQEAIVVSTQVVEAGLDVSATTLFTELAPWPSLVQRFGRCNRGGRQDSAAVFWVDVPTDQESAGTKRKSLVPPYSASELDLARSVLEKCADAAIGRLPEVRLAFQHDHVIRRRDLLDLFDTTPDLSGLDLDVSRFIRIGDDRTVRVYWRELAERPARIESLPSGEELCPVPVEQFRSFVKALADRRDLKGDARFVWYWEATEGRWLPVAHADARHGERAPIVPGFTYLIPAGLGGYDRDRGWTGDTGKAVEPLPAAASQGQPADSECLDTDPDSDRPEVSLARHSDDTAREAMALVASLALSESQKAAVMEACRWHDLGKSHPVFQKTLRGEVPPEGAELLAKSRGAGSRRHEREGFRHELASALAAISHGRSDLVAYLVGAHHGKVRVSVRSTESDRRAAGATRGTTRIRGIDPFDTLPAVDLGAGVVVPETRLSLDLVRLGGDGSRPSWTSRVLALRDDPGIGPFRLAYLETLVRVADWRASGDAIPTVGRPETEVSHA